MAASDRATIAIAATNNALARNSAGPRSRRSAGALGFAGRAVGRSARSLELKSGRSSRAPRPDRTYYALGDFLRLERTTDAPRRPRATKASVPGSGTGFGFDTSAVNPMFWKSTSALDPVRNAVT